MTSYYESGGGGSFAFPRLTKAIRVLLLINVGVFLVNAVLQGSLGDWLGVSTSNLMDGFGLGVLRLVSYQFVHDFYSPFHLLFNMLFLYVFGTMVEERIGAERTYRLYLLAGLAGGILYLLSAWALGSDVPVVGASGACYGLIVYAAFLAPRTRVILFIFPIELRYLVGGLVFLGVYQSYVELVTGASGTTAHSAHLGGALWGFLAFRFRGTFELGTNRIRIAVERRKEQTRQEKQAEMDRLLEKVHNEGLSALTAAERKFMDRASAEMRRK